MFLPLRGLDFREDRDDVFNCMKEGVVGMARGASSPRVPGSRIGTWYFDYWWPLVFGDSVLRLV